MEKLIDDSERGRRLIQLLERRRLRFAREDSFKLLPGELLAQRTLIGIPSAEIDVSTLLEIGAELGMPPDYRSLIEAEFRNSNFAFFGLEERESGGVFKIYLELWEKLRQQVMQTGSAAPSLLNIGVKWDTESGAHCRADYLCHPMLSVADIFSRIDSLYLGRMADPGRVLSRNIIRKAATQNPTASFLYVEVKEGDSPRSSFDINLYKGNLTVSNIDDLLIEFAKQYEIDSDGLGSLCKRIGAKALGHVSGGLDRHGRSFITIYYEVLPRH